MAYNNIKVKERQTVKQSSQTQQLGIVSEVPMNEWNVDIPYEKLNIVTYKNRTFIAKRANTNIPPLDTDGWEDTWMLLKDGVCISLSTIEYASGSTSSPTAPEDGWSSELPAFQAGQLLWTRLTITYTDDTQAVFYSVGVTVAPTKTSDLQNDGNDGTSPFGTEAFINSSINNLAAFYITYNAEGAAFPTKAVLTGATTFYNDKKPRVPTTNDYAIVLADESQPKNVDGSYPTTRYIYQGGTYPAGSWSFQWVLNNTPFTQAQVDAINSGITEAKVAQIEANRQSIITVQNNAIPKIEKGVANGVATLNDGTEIPQEQIPKEFSDVHFIIHYDKLDTSVNVDGESIRITQTDSDTVTIKNDGMEVREGATDSTYATFYGHNYINNWIEGELYNYRFPEKSGTLLLDTDMVEVHLYRHHINIAGDFDTDIYDTYDKPYTLEVLVEKYPNRPFMCSGGRMKDAGYTIPRNVQFSEHKSNDRLVPAALMTVEALNIMLSGDKYILTKTTMTDVSYTLRDVVDKIF